MSAPNPARECEGPAARKRTDSMPSVGCVTAGRNPVAPPPGAETRRARAGGPGDARQLLQVASGESRKSAPRGQSPLRRRPFHFVIGPPRGDRDRAGLGRGRTSAGRPVTTRSFHVERADGGEWTPRRGRRLVRGLPQPTAPHSARVPHETGSPGTKLRRPVSRDRPATCRGVDERSVAPGSAERAAIHPRPLVRFHVERSEHRARGSARPPARVPLH